MLADNGHYPPSTHCRHRQKQSYYRSGSCVQITGVKISDKMTEKDLTLKIALLVQKELTKSEPIQVLLTRDKDTDISLQERMKKISQRYIPKLWSASMLMPDFIKPLKDLKYISPDLNLSKTGKDESSAIINDMTKNRSLNESVRLAQNIQKQL